MRHGTVNRRARTYWRRRLLALTGLTASVIVVVWVIFSSGGSGGPGHENIGSSSRGASSSPAARRTHRARAAVPLPVAGIPVGRWVGLPAAPSPRGEVSAARLGDFAYVVGGFDAAGH